MLSPVPGPTSTPADRPSSAAASGLTRPTDSRARRPRGSSATSSATPGMPEHLGRVCLRRRRPPAGTGGVAPVGHRPAAQALGQVVVGQADGPRPVCCLRLGPAEPGPPGDGDRGHRDRPDAIGPCVGAPGRDEALSVRRGASVVPQDSGADRPSAAVERHQAVLLSRDRDRGDLARAACLRQGEAERRPPALGIALAGTARSGHLVGRSPHRHASARSRARRAPPSSPGWSCRPPRPGQRAVPRSASSRASSRCAGTRQALPCRDAGSSVARRDVLPGVNHTPVPRHRPSRETVSASPAIACVSPAVAARR